MTKMRQLRCQAFVYLELDRLPKEKLGIDYLQQGYKSLEGLGFIQQSVHLQPVVFN